MQMKLIILMQYPHPQTDAFSILFIACLHEVETRIFSVGVVTS
jgi:hypothetical protein